MARGGADRDPRPAGQHHHHNPQRGPDPAPEHRERAYLDFTHDAANRLSQIQDFAGRTVAYEYNIPGTLSKATFPDAIFEEYTYDGAGRMLTVKDPRGNTMVTNVYDDNGASPSNPWPIWCRTSGQVHLQNEREGRNSYLKTRPLLTTQRITDGGIVTVDGNAGTVVVH